MRGETVIPKPKRKPRGKETKPRARTEATLLARIGRDCDVLELGGHILWHDRLNSGMAQRGRYWIKLCKAGTADRVIYCKDKLVIFIETKGKGKQEPEQFDFMYKVVEAGHLYFLIDNWEHWAEVRDRYIYKEAI